jgi:hypothetical protein
MYKKVTRNDINKNNMVTLGYGQCQMILGLFGEDYKVGYNSGVYGWNYDLYSIHGVDVVTGYRVPYQEYCNKDLKTKLIALDNKIVETRCTWIDYEVNQKKWLREFLEIFK